MENISLIERFTRYFEVVPARDDATRLEVQQLRHAVYCEEMGYEPLSPDGLEKDECDSHSLFVLVRHRANNRAAGCMRLIKHPGLPDWRFPFERACGETLYPEYTDLAQRQRAVEVSRLAVHQDFRRRRGDYDSPEGGGNSVTDISDRHYPLIAMGLFLAGSAVVINEDTYENFVMMEPRLARLLQSCGLCFTRVGALVDHHGQRAPYRIRTSELLVNLRPESRELQQYMVEALR